MNHPLTLAALAFAAMIVSAHAQIVYDQYGNRHDFYRGTVETNPAFEPYQAPASTWQLPTASQRPDWSSIPDTRSEPEQAPCTMPGCP